MVTDEQYRELLEKYNELNKKYAQMSRDIAAIKMSIDVVKARRNTDNDIVQKDITRYSFQGKTFNKRRLVLECIKQYIMDTGTNKADALLELFPEHIQGSLGVIRRAEEAEKYEGAAERYFFNDDEVLDLDTGIYVVSKDWTINNIDRFINQMKKLGYEIKPILR